MIFIALLPLFSFGIKKNRVCIFLIDRQLQSTMEHGTDADFTTRSSCLPSQNRYIYIFPNLMWFIQNNMNSICTINYKNLRLPLNSLPPPLHHRLPRMAITFSHNRNINCSSIADSFKMCSSSPWKGINTKENNNIIIIIILWALAVYSSFLIQCLNATT